MLIVADRHSVRQIQMDNIEIKKVKLADIADLQAISRQTFFETFAEQNTAEDMQNYLINNLSVEKLKNELTNTHSEFYFAIHNNKVIGYLKINSAQVQTELKNKSSLEIERIYVLKEFQGKKAGQFLFDKAIEIARQTNSDYV